jgi:hypothetical protein
MISRTSQVYLDNLKYQKSFGGELMVVVLDGDVTRLFTARNRAALAAIESDIAKSGRFHTIIGPDTAVTFATRPPPQPRPTATPSPPRSPRAPRPMRHGSARSASSRSTTPSGCSSSCSTRRATSGHHSAGPSPT